MKTPKRDYKDYNWLPDCAERPDLHELESIKEDTRWKRKNRVRQLKNTITNLHIKQLSTDSRRQIARRQLGRIRDFLLIQARACTVQKHRVELLQYVGNCNLFLTLSMSPDELDLEFAGVDVRPYKLQLTEEERKIIRSEDDTQP